MALFFDTREVCFWLDRDKATLSTWLNEGKFPSPNFSGRPNRWTSAALMQWVEDFDDEQWAWRKGIQQQLANLEGKEPLTQAVLRDRLNWMIEQKKELIRQQQLVRINQDAIAG